MVLIGIKNIITSLLSTGWFQETNCSEFTKQVFLLDFLKFSIKIPVIVCHLYIKNIKAVT